ncbi:hypothetical protein BJX70DRAFT_400084 [Aspergillus crustosus]
MPATDFQHQIQPAPAAAASSVLGISPRSEGNALFQKSASPHETTRFSAVFFENQDSFGSVIGDGVKCSHEPEQELDMPSWSRMELAYRILLNSPTARTCEMLMTGLHYIHDVWVSPLMIQKCLNQVWTLYGDCLGEDRTRESVMNIANEICANTRKPIAIPTDDAGHDTDSPGWVNWFSGPDLRWEMVGILFSWAGMAFRHKQECDPVFALSEQHGRNRSTAANKMRECAAACIRLCGEHFEISDLMVVCMKNSSKLQSIIISHESDLIRVDFGSVRSAFTAAGLHRLSPLKTVTPLSQHRACQSA